MIIICWFIRWMKTSTDHSSLDKWWPKSNSITTVGSTHVLLRCHKCWNLKFNDIILSWTIVFIHEESLSESIEIEHGMESTQSGVFFSLEWYWSMGRIHFEFKYLSDAKTHGTVFIITYIQPLPFTIYQLLSSRFLAANMLFGICYAHVLTLIHIRCTQKHKYVYFIKSAHTHIYTFYPHVFHSTLQLHQCHSYCFIFPMFAYAHQCI